MGRMVVARSLAAALVVALAASAVPTSSAHAAGGFQYAARMVRAIDATPTSTGLTVAAGEILTFSATGTWCMGGTPPTAECGTAAGIRPANPEELPLILDTAPIGALIARVGSGPWFMVGASATLPMPNAGTLTVVFNDRPCCYLDNSGEIYLTVSSVRDAPGFGDPNLTSEQRFALAQAFAAFQACVLSRTVPACGAAWAAAVKLYLAPGKAS